MDNLAPIVLDIVSDEEVGFGETRKCSGYSSGGGIGDREDHNWLSKILGELDKGKDDGDDDVVVVSEVFEKSKNCGEIVVVVVDEDDDDDCVMLDGDPEEKNLEAVAVGSGRGDGGGDGDEEDLEIIGEKGEVACRDFPHPRHLCAKHPFASTPHNLHCCQCHCYVCDSLAPCAGWGTGISSIDHCHASEKDERWKTERKRIKNLNNRKPVLPRTIDSYFSTQPRRTAQIPQLPTPPPNSIQDNHDLRPINMPNVSNEGRSHPSDNVASTCKLQPQLVPQQLHTTCLTNNTTRGKIGNSGPRFNSPRPVFKRSGSIGVSLNYDKSCNGSQLPRDISLRRCLSFPHPVSNNQNIPQPISSISESINVGDVHYTHSQPQMTWQSLLSDSYVDRVPFQSYASQPNLGNFDDTFISQPTTDFQPNNPISSGQITTNNTFEDQSSQLQGFGNSTSLLIDGQHNFQQRSQGPTQSSVNTYASDFSHDRHASQLQNVVSADNSQFPSMTEDAYSQSVAAADIDNASQLQNVASADNYPFQSMTEDAYSPSLVATDIDNLSLVKDIDCHMPESRYRDFWHFDPENCAFEDADMYLPEARDVLLAAGKNPDLFLPPGW